MKTISTLLIIALFYQGVGIAQTDTTGTGAREHYQNSPYTQQQCSAKQIPLSIFFRYNVSDIQRADFVRSLRSVTPTSQWWFWTSIGAAVVAVAVFLIWFNAEQKIRVERSK